MAHQLYNSARVGLCVGDALVASQGQVARMTAGSAALRRADARLAAARAGLASTRAELATVRARIAARKRRLGLD